MSSKKLPVFLQNVKSTLDQHPVCFTTGLLFALSLGGERLLEAVAFKCPCDENAGFYYGLSFLLGPCFLLFVFGLLLSNYVWRVFHGFSKRTSSTKLTTGQYTISICNIVARALAIPIVWLFISLLDGDYIACIMAKNPCKPIVTPACPQDLLPGICPRFVSQEYKDIVSWSQVAGWALMGLVVFLGGIITCILKCCHKRTFLENQYAKYFRELENVKMDQAMKTKAETLAEKHVALFMDKEIIDGKTWDEVGRVHLVKGDETKNVFYTPLQKHCANVIL